jgi:hypothetical protein
MDHVRPLKPSDMSPEELEQAISASLRYYMLLLMHKFAPPEGLVFSAEEIKAFKESPRNQLMIYQRDGQVVVRMVAADEVALALAPPGGNG